MYRKYVLLLSFINFCHTTKTHLVVVKRNKVHVYKGTIQVNDTTVKQDNKQSKGEGI